MNIPQNEIENIGDALNYGFGVDTTTHFSEYMLNDINPFFEMVNYINNDIEKYNDTDEGKAIETLALLYRLCQMSFGQYLETELSNSLHHEFTKIR
jgi:hypothetical protein